MGDLHRGIYKVLQPTGPVVGELIRGASRLDTLNGKTLCEVWNGGYRGDRTFPLIRRLLQKEFPGVNIVPFTEFPLARHYNIDEILQDFLQLFEQKGCDALISGNGG